MKPTVHLNPIRTSLLFMGLAWALAFCTRWLGGRDASFLAVDALITGAFVLLAWTIFVLPALFFDRACRADDSLRLTWPAWGLVALLIYGVAVSTQLGPNAILFLWYPALIGFITSFVFALLKPDARATTPPAPTDATGTRP